MRTIAVAMAPLDTATRARVLLWLTGVCAEAES